MPLKFKKKTGKSLQKKVANVQTELLMESQISKKGIQAFQATMVTIHSLLLDKMCLLIKCLL